MRLMKIKIHSIVDVITNSSSEIFVCNTDKTLEVVREFLAEMLKFYNAFLEKDLLFEDVFLDLRWGVLNSPPNF